MLLMDVKIIETIDFISVHKLLEYYDLTWSATMDTAVLTGNCNHQLTTYPQYSRKL